MDTLRSIVEGMRCDYSYDSLRYGPAGWEHDPTKCPKCRLEALLAEYEDLVKKWREPNVNVRCDENGGSVSYDTSYDATRLQCADELETWLAVNLERIKAQAERDGATKVLSWASRLYCQCEELAPLKCSIHNFIAELDDSPIALEAQAKEKP